MTVAPPVEPLVERRRWGAQHRFLLRELVVRDLQSRYAGSTLGFAWAMVQPLWQLALFTFVFSALLKFRLPGERTDSFAIFLFCGLLPWLAFHEGVSKGTTAITDNSDLVKRLRFPAEILVLAAVLGALANAGVGALVFIVVLAWIGELSVFGLWGLLIAVPIQIGLTTGLGLLFSSVHVFFRDCLQAVTLVLGALFYVTPIVYSLGFVEAENLRRVIALNPITGLVGLYRESFLGAGFAMVPGLASLFITTALSLVAGVWLFRRARPHFADEI